MLDQLILIIPMAVIVGVAVYCRRYVKDVSSYLVAGRVAGRYVLSVSNAAVGGMGLLILIGYLEAHYKTGFAIQFWNNLSLPLGLILALTGFCTYRYRETKCMSFGQFVEMRYSRAMRIFAAILRVISEILASMIAPALAARFFICLFNWPNSFTLFGIVFSTYITVVVVVLIMALLIIWFGGSIGLMVTDCMQGLIMYPLVALFVVFVLWKFSWVQEIVPMALDRGPGESFLDPFDVSNLRDFNMFAFVVTMAGSVLHRASWIGSSSSSAARSPHEQKMAGILVMYSGGLYGILCILLALMTATLLNHVNFAKDAKIVRGEIACYAAGTIALDKVVKEKIVTEFKKFPAHSHVIGKDEPLTHKKNLDTPYLQAAEKVIVQEKVSRGKQQEFNTLFHQLMLPFSMRHLLPSGLLGLFALLMALMMLSTDDSRIFNSASTIAQDIIVPFRKKPFSPENHVLMIKCCSLFVGLIFFLGSVLLAQMDYVNLFVQIVCSIWMGGCAPVMLGGLYWKFGNTKGAWASLLVGMTLSLGGMYLQWNWADVFYPWLETYGLIEQTGKIFETLSAPFHPYIVWEMNPTKFPINSIEIYAITNIISILSYIVVSAITFKGYFNMDKMLHRGIYNLDNEPKPKIDWNLKKIFPNLIGITKEYSFIDKCFAYFTFYYSFVYQFLIAFLMVWGISLFYRWPPAYWGDYFFWVYLIIPGVIGSVMAVWFTWHGVIDLKRLFYDLKNRSADDLDNGMVVGSVSLADKEHMEDIENSKKQNKG